MYKDLVLCVMLLLIGCATDNPNPPAVPIVSETVEIIVNDVNRLPIIAPIGNKSIDEGQLLEFVVSASDPDGDMVTLSVIDLPQGATFNASTGKFSWTPNSGQAGLYRVTFSATDD